VSAPTIIHADAFDDYELFEVIALPTGAGPYDVLSDGRIILLVDSDVYVESTVQSGLFAVQGSLPAADFSSFGAGFLRVSPDGTKMAIGNSGGASFGNYEVGVFEVTTLTGSWFTAVHFDAAWIDNTQLALSAGLFGNPSFVSILDTSSADPSNPTNPIVVDNIGGASGGVIFDAAGNLYTGNGFSTSGPSGTGVVKAFDAASWMAAISGPPIDFETSGILIVDILSASPLGFDLEGNLYVGGGDVAPDDDSVALIRASAVADALNGMGAVDVLDPLVVRRLDPITTSPFNFYAASFNRVTHELYVRDFGDPTLYAYREPMLVPAVSEWGMIALSLLTLTAGTLSIRQSVPGTRV